ncbi:uncharacterized protein B0H18DRAFT_1122873 [Fomitopsis serialis]|uniref:uncharacterized protein n=1 Tax=Fomitopsis serialis TaxID=139415 RepID=UPI0020072AC8|nr:uncharacterized protein B0H18DRAFT_1122873 [Neoantrodia serialis]KAH9918797.1 hypothetical protein B0H18DRAFT_1122873 [Neoantrodia serialis]
MPSTVAHGVTVAAPTRPQSPPKRKKVNRDAATVRKMAARNKLKNQEIDAAISKWYDDSEALANSLAEQYGNKPQHYMNQMFSSADKWMHARKPSAWNAWLSALATQANEDTDPGDTSRLLDLQSEYRDSYDKLTLEQKN